MSDKEDELGAQSEAPRRYTKRSNRTSWKDLPDRHGFHIAVKKAIATFGDKAFAAILAELMQMLDLKV